MLCPSSRTDNIEDSKGKIIREPSVNELKVPAWAKKTE